MSQTLTGGGGGKERRASGKLETPRGGISLYPLQGVDEAAEADYLEEIVPPQTSGADGQEATTPAKRAASGTLPLSRPGPKGKLASTTTIFPAAGNRSLAETEGEITASRKLYLWQDVSPHRFALFGVFAVLFLYLTGYAESLATGFPFLSSPFLHLFQILLGVGITIGMFQSNRAQLVSFQRRLVSDPKRALLGLLLNGWLISGAVTIGFLFVNILAGVLGWPIRPVLFDFAAGDIFPMVFFLLSGIVRGIVVSLGIALCLVRGFAPLAPEA
ncbi:MAG: hypothetical protein D6795_04945 [Deltaproteobacteria bacterium]|nr:MAG: hypothetical protein D6795_04945 [Deltaproteobacteria bacterium]